MTIVVKHLPKYVYGRLEATTVLTDTLSACIYFGLSILTAPASRSARIAAAIGVEVKNASSHTSALSPENASITAEKIMEQIPPSRRADIRPLVSIITSDQLAGLVRRVADYIRPHEPDAAAVSLVCHLKGLKLDVPAQFCPCKEESKNYPICLCALKPLSQS